MTCEFCGSSDIVPYRVKDWQECQNCNTLIIPQEWHDAHPGKEEVVTGECGFCGSTINNRECDYCGWMSTAHIYYERQSDLYNDFDGSV